MSEMSLLRTVKARTGAHLPKAALVASGIRILGVAGSKDSLVKLKEGWRHLPMQL